MGYVIIENQVVGSCFFSLKDLEFPLQKIYNKMRFFILAASFLLFCTLAAEDWLFDEDVCCSPLLRDLMICECVDRKLSITYPTLYNNLLQGGYINMPSASMGVDGEVGFGWSSVPPYRNWNLRAQLTERVELTGNYRVFLGVDDPILSPHGFGDLSDKGANIKIALIRTIDSDYDLPGLSIGFEDFMGTKNFNAFYIVTTQVIKKMGLELSFGYGAHRINHWFGGLNWMPFWRFDRSFLRTLSFCAEYDATDYLNPKHEPHPAGRFRKTHMNYGIKYRLWDHVDFCAARIRGLEWSFALSATYNLGETQGLVPKIQDPMVYRAPVVIEPYGYSRPLDVVSADLAYAFENQGFDLLEIRLDNNTFYMRVYNNVWRLEPIVRERISYILAGLVPLNIDTVIVVIESEGFSVQQYTFPMQHVRKFGCSQICDYELQILSPLTEARRPPADSVVIFRKRRDLWNFEIVPKTQTFFGSSSGKFKYALGVSLNLNGFLFNEILYCASFGCFFASNIKNLQPVDLLNPSQIINVRTDIIRYYQVDGITVDQLYAQKNWNLGGGWYSRVACGYFEPMYGGTALELIYFPLHRPWAFGVEGAYLAKRVPGTVGFTTQTTQYVGWDKIYRKFHGSQYFLDFYYNLKECRLDFKVMAGKFLADDWGGRFEVSRYFPSGLRMTFWYTRTNGRDYLNGERYHDKGIELSMPLDLFYTHSERSRWHYKMAAWLRDVGVIGDTGKNLYYLISELRQTRSGQID
jgi:hypothetical protein